jgi:hypothetical protein
VVSINVFSLRGAHFDRPVTNLPPPPQQQQQQHTAAPATRTPILTEMAMTMQRFWSQHDPSKKEKNCCGFTVYHNAIDLSLPSLFPKPLWSANAAPHASELALTLLFQMAQNVKGNQNLSFESLRHLFLSLPYPCFSVLNLA